MTSLPRAVRFPGALRITRYRPQFPGQKMIRRPGPADGDFAILQLLGGTAVAILVLLDGFRLNQVSNIDQHAAGINTLAANLFLKRIEHFMYLDGQGPCLGLALAIT